MILAANQWKAVVRKVKLKNNFVFRWISNFILRIFYGLVIFFNIRCFSLLKSRDVKYSILKTKRNAFISSGFGDAPCIYTLKKSNV